MGLAGIQHQEGSVQGVKELAAHRVVLTQMDGDAVSHPGQSQELASGQVRLDQKAGLHQQLAARIAQVVSPHASPAVQLQAVRATVLQGAGQADLLVMPVAGGVEQAVEIHGRLGMAEVARLAQG